MTLWLPAAHVFFKEAVLPEMCFKYWTVKSSAEASVTHATGNTDKENDSGNVAEMRYCFCGGPESSEMIM